MHPAGCGDAEAADEAPGTVVGMEPLGRDLALQCASKMGVNVGLHGSHGLPPAVPSRVVAKTPGHRTEHPGGAIVIDLHGLRRLKCPGAGGVASLARLLARTQRAGGGRHGGDRRASRQEPTSRGGHQRSADLGPTTLPPGLTRTVPQAALDGEKERGA